MTPTQLLARLDALRNALRTLTIASVLTWGAGAAVLCLIAGTVLRVTQGAPAAPVVSGVALAVGALVSAWRWTRERPSHLGRVDAALWAEAQVPALRYALVTLAEQDRAADADPVQQRLAAFSNTTGWQSPVQRALRRARVLHIGRVALLVAVAAVAAYPWQGRTAVASAAASLRVAGTSAAAEPGRVAATTVVVPPSYAGRAERRVDFGQTIEALVGSVIRIDAVGAPDGAMLLVQESADSGATAPREIVRAPTPAGWRGVVRIGSEPLAIRLRDPVGERWVLVTPVPDSVPQATLLLPAADTLVFDTTAVIRVQGTIHDDIGLRDARIEYIISSGGGEQFTFKSGVLAARSGALGRDLSVGASLDLGVLGLKAGDLMHVRLVAHDGNTVGGPSLGTSETRTIRIPRADERDSVSVEQLPPTPVDKSVLSQRQLLMLTERLVARMPRIDRAVMLAESQRLGVDQAKLRKQVADIVFARLGDSPSGEHAHFPGDGHEHTATELATASTPESVLKAADRATGGVSGMLDSHGDETPVVAVNRPLLEAYNAMWDATRALQGGTPREALDPMRRAVAAIQRARAAERIYLRGTPPAAVVDLAKVRLIGTDSAKFEARRALAALPATDRRLGERALQALASLTARDSTALDALRLVRLDALGSAPALATALGELVAQVDAGRDATAAVLRVRRLAIAPWRAGGGTTLWAGSVP